MGGTYDGLVTRGESLVTRIRRQESTQATAAVGEDHDDQGQDDQDPGHQGHQVDRQGHRQEVGAPKTAAKKSAPAKSSAKATGTAAKKTASNGHPGRRRRRPEGRRLTDRPEAPGMTPGDPGGSVSSVRGLYRGCRNNVFQIEGSILLVVSLVLLAMKIFALVTALMFSPEHYRAADKLTKPAWVAILGIGVLAPRS